MPRQTDYKGYVAVVVVVAVRPRSRITQRARYFIRLPAPPAKGNLLKAGVTGGARAIFLAGGNPLTDTRALVIRLGTLPGRAGDNVYRGFVKCHTVSPTRSVSRERVPRQKSRAHASARNREILKSRERASVEQTFGNVGGLGLRRSGEVLSRLVAILLPGMFSDATFRGGLPPTRIFKWKRRIAFPKRREVVCRLAHGLASMKAAFFGIRLHPHLLSTIRRTLTSNATDVEDVLQRGG